MSQRGYTLIEVMTVLVLIGILAALSTRASSSKAAASMAVMKSDLRNIATAQEAYYSTYLTYADNTADLDFSNSVNISVRLRGGETGWSGRAAHAVRDTWRCALYVGGGVTAFEPATEEGKMVCEPAVKASGCFGG